MARSGRHPLHQERSQRPFHALFMCIDWQQIDLTPPANPTCAYVLGAVKMYIEKLTADHVVHQDAYERQEKNLQQAMRCLIPRQYWRGAGMSRNACNKKYSDRNGGAFVFNAATLYINHLICKKKPAAVGKAQLSRDRWAKEEEVWLNGSEEDSDGERFEHKEASSNSSSPTTRTDDLPAQPNSEHLVEQALKKMDRWIDRHLEGSLEDTENVAKCLEWPDI